MTLVEGVIRKIPFGFDNDLTTALKAGIYKFLMVALTTSLESGVVRGRQVSPELDCVSARTFEHGKSSRIIPPPAATSRRPPQRQLLDPVGFVWGRPCFQKYTDQSHSLEIRACHGSGRRWLETRRSNVVVPNVPGQPDTVDSGKAIARNALMRRSHP